MIGRYRVKRVLGTGTFATVFLAEDEALAVPVAVKLLAENWSYDLGVRERFIREARLLRRVESPRLVRVHDIGAFEQRPYFVMDLVAGETLAERLEAAAATGGVPADDEIGRLAGELAECVDAAHSHGVVHRDVKPGNLMFRSPGSGALVGWADRLVLADFGLARDQAVHSGYSVGAGTRGYMAPEQTAVAGRVDERADLYACSMILLVALTAAGPGSVGDPEAVARLLAGLPDAWREFFSVTLAPDPAARPASAGAWQSLVAETLGVVPGTRSPTRIALASWLRSARRRALVGRTAEMERAEAAAARAIDGERLLLTVAGEAGIGKTRLVAELATRLHARGALVLAGRGGRSDRGPYATLVEALHPAVDELTRVADASDVTAELGRLFPARASGLGTPEEHPHPEVGRRRLVDAIDALGVRLGPSLPLVLVLDDAPGADAATLSTVRALLEAPLPAPLLVIATCRQGAGAAAEWGELLAAARDRGAASELALAGLDDIAVRAVAEDLAGAAIDASTAAALARHTGGNPLFLEAVVRLAADSRREMRDAVATVPDGVRDVIRARLGRLGPVARTALEVAATIGDEFDPRVVDLVVGEGAGAALDDAVAADLLRRSPEGYVFRHGLVRSLLLADVDPRTRQDRHRRIGEAIARLHVADPEPYLAVVAHHLGAGVTRVPDARAADHLARAARVHFRALAFEEAVAALEAALAVGPDGPDAAAGRIELLELLAETHFWRDDPDAMRSAALAAAELARGAGRAEDLARLAVVAARWNRGGEIPDDVLAELDAAERALSPSDLVWRSQVLAMRAYVLHGAGRGFDVRAMAARAEAMARESGDVEALTLALLVRTYAETGSPDVDRARTLVQELEDAAARVPRHDHREHYLSFALRARAQVQLALGDRAGFSVTRSELATVADRMRAAYVRSVLLQWDAAVATAEGRFVDATRAADKALATWSARPDARAFHAIQHGVLSLHRGEHARVVATIEPMVAADPSSRAFAWRAVAVAARAADGDPGPAQRWLTELTADGFAGLRDDHQRPLALRWLSEAAAASGHRAAADALLPVVEPYRGSVLVGAGLATIECAADRAIGQLLLTLGDGRRASAALDAAVECETALGFTALATRSSWWLARALLAAGERDRAAATARRVVGTAARIGMTAVAAGAATLV